MIPGETIHSMLPQDLPWWRPDHAIFFIVLYLILLIIGSSLGSILIRSIFHTFQKEKKK